MAENIDQCMTNDFSHRIMKEIQFLIGERYRLGINCLGIENLSYLFENQCLITLEGGETPMSIIRFEWSLYDLVNVLGLFIKLNLPILLVLVGQQQKSQKFFDLSTLN